jgi:hypothetical protein
MQTIDQSVNTKGSLIISKALKWSARALGITVWTSSAIFGLYIIAFYFSALFEGDLERWNKILPRLYETETTTATSGIGLHFLAGGIILMLGSIQLLEAFRQRFPGAHRMLGKIYVLASLLAAAGGLVFIAAKGTVGGTVMNIGFSGYGLLMGWAAIETFRHARARNFLRHRAWAIRLFALAIGSWLYRMDYGFWFILADGLGHTEQFSGAFDQVMAFFFYVPNLLVAEFFIRAGHQRLQLAMQFIGSLVLFASTAFILVGSFFFTTHVWGKAILAWLGLL